MTPWKRLVDQQFWLFGRDVVAERGNRLLELGGQRAAAWRRGKAACYSMPVSGDTDAAVVLWGFGSLYLRSGLATAYLQRATGHVRVPTARQREMDWKNATAESFFDWAVTSSREAELRPLAHWMATHERAVQKTYGREARVADVAGWATLGKKTIDADRLVEQWTMHAVNDQVCSSPITTVSSSRYAVA